MVINSLRSSLQLGGSTNDQALLARYDGRSFHPAMRKISK
jgi:hypothetical protein